MNSKNALATVDAAAETPVVVENASLSRAPIDLEIPDLLETATFALG